MDPLATPPLTIWVLHGPNLNLLGSREPEHYGSQSLDAIDAAITHVAASLGATVACSQSNHEGTLVDWVHEAQEAEVDGIVINPAALTHNSIALRDAITGVAIPTVEVHLSNIYAREPFRHKSMISDVAIGVISGFGAASYTLGLRALIDYLHLGR